MHVLHIEHPITDFEIWQGAFDRFADARRAAGVRSHRIHRPVGDPDSIVVALDFDDRAAAESFLAFLQEAVWASPDASPALAGVPVTRILEVEAMA